MTTGYRPQAEDTSIEADRYLFRLLAQRSNEQRMMMTAQVTKGARKMSLMGLKSRFGHLDESAFRLKVAKTWLGDHGATGFEVKGNPMTWHQDSIELAQQLHAIFETLGIAYYVTGEVAATTYGEPRMTIDLDLVINISGADIYPLVSLLEAEKFYIPGVEDVVSGRMQILQITHQETIARADLMMAGREEWDAIKLERRRSINGIYLASPEDVILNKLRWRQRSQSEQQWRDVLGILKVQGAQLEFDYLQKWAEQLGLLTDFEQACQQSGFP